MFKSISLVFAAVGIFWSGIANAEYLDRRIRIHNMTDKRIVELYGSPIDARGYGYNMIQGPEDWIRAGQTRVADIDDGTGYCRYDLKVVRADGAVAEKYNVNVCELTDWWIYD